MRILPVNSYSDNAATKKSVNPAFNAKVKVTGEASTYASNAIHRNRNAGYLLLHKAIDKLNKRIYEESPLGKNITFDVIKNKSKVAPNGKISNFEMKLGDKSVDYYFDFENIMRDPSYFGKSEEERINIEAAKQSDYLYNTFNSLRAKRVYA